MSSIPKTELLRGHDWDVHRKDILGLRFGKLLVIFPAGKGNAGVTQWLCRCDCGAVKTIRTADLTNKCGGTKSCGCGRFRNITGKRFGRLVAVKCVSSDSRGRTTWECRCDCGKTVDRTMRGLASGDAKSCGCLKRQPRGKIDLTGQTFGRLTALHVDERKSTVGRGGRTRWACSCNCGGTAIVEVAKLRSGHTRSCGCLAKESGGRRPLPGNAAKINALFRLYRSRAKRRGLAFDLSRDNFASLVVMECSYCGKKPAQSIGQNKQGPVFFYNGVDRVDNDLGYSADNCVPCCKQCNFAKGEMSKDEFFAHTLQIVTHNLLGVNT